MKTHTKRLIGKIITINGIDYFVQSASPNASIVKLRKVKKDPNRSVDGDRR